MLSLAPFAEGSIMDPRFSSRGFMHQRQGPISDSPYLAIALEKQIAYEGYKNNIDVFLAATANQKKYNINIPGVNLEAPIEHKFPLDLPRTVISFKLGVPKVFIENTLEKLKKVTEVTKVEGVKGHPNAYLVDRPPQSFIKFIKMYVMPLAPRTEGYAQLGETEEAAKILHYIELYLRTNTYPAFKDDEDVIHLPDHFVSEAEKRPAFMTESTLTKKPRYTHVTMTHKMGKESKEREEKGKWFGVESDADVMIVDSMDTSVHFAKPSPAHDSSASWSAPKDVPSLPGMCFPYFNGMVTNDNRAMRYIPGEHFLRLFGEEPKAGFIAYRARVSGFASTTTGVIMSHILHGVDISIKTQTKLHLLFDGSSYLGFVILGAKWAIQRGTKWFAPKNSSDLSADLKSIVTHESSLAEVIEKLGMMGIHCDEGCDACDLAEALAEIKWETISDEDERKDTQRWFEERVGRLDFGTRPIHFGADTLVACVKDIVEAPVDGLSNHVHFPPAKDYAIFKSVDAIALARFGYLAPSFIIDKGTQSVRVSSLHADAKEGEGARKMVSKVMIAMKPLTTAVKDFQTFRSNKHIFQGCTERAATYRLHTLGGDPKDRFLKGMGLVVNLLKGSVLPVTSGPSKKKDEGTVMVESEFVMVDVPDFA